MEPQVSNAQASEILPIALVEMDGEPRGYDLDLGLSLGFTRPRRIRGLVRKHLPALEQFGPVRTAAGRTSLVGGRRSPAEYWLNEGQCLYLGAKSDAENSSAVLTMLVRVFMAWRHGHLVPAEGLDARDTGGIVKKVLNKHSREVVIPSVREIVASEQDTAMQVLRSLVVDIIRQEAQPLAATHSPMRTILDALRIPTLNRRSLQGKIQHRASVQLAERPQKCPLRGVLLYPRVATETFVRERCDDLVRAHHDRISRQGLLDLKPPKGDPPLPN